MIYFTSDLHFGHKLVNMYCSRPFASTDEMDDALVAKWNAVVKRGDTVYIVGDLVWESDDPLKYLKKLKGNKILVAGNHDMKWLRRLGMVRTGIDNREEFVEFGEYFTDIVQFAEISTTDGVITLCHYPLLEWRASRKYGSKKLGYLVHGHIHNRVQGYESLLIKPHALNAGVDINGYAPVTFEQLVDNNEKYKLSVLDRLDRAKFVAAKYHMYQTDLGGYPYFDHLKAVASFMPDEISECTAYLHDVLEYTDVDERLLERWFDTEIVDAVKLLTYRRNTDYFEYIAELSDNPLAVRVKLAELAHNFDLSRLRSVGDDDLARAEKYRKAYEILKNRK